MENHITYKSFCWSLGTTSFRTEHLNKDIEQLLAMLRRFRAEETAAWSSNDELQTSFYDLMRSEEFVKGNAQNKPKDARQITSGLVSIGLIDDNRLLTAAGQQLLSISEKGDFKANNVFRLEKDSYIYLKQLVKTSVVVDGKTVRPFVVLLYVLSRLSYLTHEEYSYLLPLCTNEANTEHIINNITKLRKGKTTVNEVIIDFLMTMDNYQAGLRYMLKHPVTEATVTNVGMNRKSRSYDKPYYPLYKALQKAYKKKDKASFTALLKAIDKINIGIRWQQYLFGAATKRIIEKEPLAHLQSTLFDSATNEAEFKTAFYKVMHLLKAKATLSDYLDLNRRYLRTTNVLLFENSEVKLTPIAKQYFCDTIDSLYKQAFSPCANLTDNCHLAEIVGCKPVDENKLLQLLGEDLNQPIDSMAVAYKIVDEIRYERLSKLIDERFTDKKLIELLDLFAERNDKKIKEMVTNDADVPTIFEYVLAILWYKVSERQGKILDFMRLSLDADLLPKTHAAGGGADIIYEYTATSHHSAHTLLLEATLANKYNQRRMEMEPVTRHLGDHLLQCNDQSSYCVFSTNDLNINVLSDFRSRKTYTYYDINDHSHNVTGMKIIPLQLAELKTIISKGITYSQLYPILEDAYKSDLMPHLWYDQMIRDTIANTE